MGRALIFPASRGAPLRSAPASRGLAPLAIPRPLDCVVCCSFVVGGVLLLCGLPFCFVRARFPPPLFFRIPPRTLLCVYGWGLAGRALISARTHHMLRSAPHMMSLYARDAKAHSISVSRPLWLTVFKAGSTDSRTTLRLAGVAGTHICFLRSTAKNKSAFLLGGGHTHPLTPARGPLTVPPNTHIHY